MYSNTTEPKVILAGNVLFLESKKLAEIVNDTLVIYKKEKDIFRKANAVGLNNKILTSEKLHYTYITFHIANKIYKTTRSNFISKGFILHFKNWEIQRFLPLSEFNKNLEVIEL
ncbi:MAG: hypothetical protein GXX85_17710 [Ignavibacteria bacterium]|nr:hypothetical protein [Ignavibacteria bacterium]